MYFVMYWCVFCYNYMIDICLCYHDFVFQPNIPIVIWLWFVYIMFRKKQLFGLVIFKKDKTRILDG